MEIITIWLKISTIIILWEAWKWVGWRIVCWWAEEQVEQYELKRCKRIKRK